MKKAIFKYLIKEFHERPAYHIITRELSTPKTTKIISLIGSRRSGKTFYFHQVMGGLTMNGIPIERIIYVDFTDDRLYPLHAGELNDLIEAYYELYPHTKDAEKYFFFDEIQDVEGWESFVRRIAGNEKAHIYVTGSSSKLLSMEIATALRGRTLAFHMYPLSFREFLAFKRVAFDSNAAYSYKRFEIKKLMEEYLVYGGFPEVVLSDILKHEILSNYYETMIYRDVVERFSIRNTMLLKMLSKFLLTNIASKFSINSYYKSLYGETKASRETLLGYLSNLEDANIFYPVHLFSYSLKAQQNNPAKVYCIDNGLRNTVAMRFSKDDGKLAENMIFLELKRRNYDIYYWNGKREVDFVLKHKNGNLTAINVCYSDEIPLREIEGLQEFKAKFNATELIILTKDAENRKDGIRYVPIWRWLLNID